MIRVVGAAILEQGKVLAALRSPTMSTPNVWEFPGGKVEPGESDASALRRELREELGIETSIGRCLGSVSTPTIELVVYVATWVDGTPVAHEHAELRWVGSTELTSLPWAPADVPFLEPLADVLSEIV